jgi:hypothetical protein
VTCHLPVNDAREERAFFRILAYLKSLKDRGIGVSGWTTSLLRPAVFHGWWWSERLEEWIPDDVVLCFIDFHLAFDDQVLTKQVDELKRTIRHWYRYYRSPQEEIWVIAHQVLRQD